MWYINTPGAAVIPYQMGDLNLSLATPFTDKCSSKNSIYRPRIYPTFSLLFLFRRRRMMEKQQQQRLYLRHFRTSRLDQMSEIRGYGTLLRGRWPRNMTRWTEHCLNDGPASNMLNHHRDSAGPKLRATSKDETTNQCWFIVCTQPAALAQH